MTGVDAPAQPSGATRTRVLRVVPWRLDHTTTWILALLLVLSGAAASAALRSDFDDWRFELGRASDRAGLCLYLTLPLVAGLSAWNAHRLQLELRGLADGLPRPALVARLAWPPIALAAVAFHLVVTGVAWSISLASGGTGRLLLAAVVIQLSAITGFSAFGGLVGGWFSSRLTAPVVLLALLGANTLFAQYGFRRISDTGTGSADVVDLVYDPAYVLPKVVLYAGLVALALPVRFDRSWVAVTRSATASAVVVLALAWVWTSQASPFRLAPEARMCQSRYVQVCEPVSFGRRGVAVDTAVSTAVQLLRADGVTDVPGRVDVVSRATVVFPAGSAALYVSPATVENPRALRREVARALSAAQSCDDPAAVAAPDEQVLTDRATLDGWLQVHTDSVEVGSFPPDRVAALDADPDRRHVLAALFSRVWTCSGVAVR